MRDKEARSGRAKFELTILVELGTKPYEWTASGWV